MEHDKSVTVLYFQGKELPKVVRCDLVSLNNGNGSILFDIAPNAEEIEYFSGRSGTLVAEVLCGTKLVWRYCREILFYPIVYTYWEDSKVFSRLDYRLVKDNKIDNMALMLKDMKDCLTSYKNELNNVHVTGGLITRVNELLDRLDIDEEKLRLFNQQHLTTRKRLISDYGISWSDRKEKI